MPRCENAAKIVTRGKLSRVCSRHFLKSSFVPECRHPRVECSSKSASFGMMYLGAARALSKIRRSAIIQALNPSLAANTQAARTYCVKCHARICWNASCSVELNQCTKRKGDTMVYFSTILLLTCILAQSTLKPRRPVPVLLRDDERT